MSDVILGTVETYSGDLVDVILDGDGDVALSRRSRDGSSHWIFEPPQLGKLIGLLQRAMPGQHGSDGGGQATAGASDD